MKRLVFVSGLLAAMAYGVVELGHVCPTLVWQMAKSHQDACFVTTESAESFVFGVSDSDSDCRARSSGSDSVFEVFTSRLIGWSMAPAICHGDVITWRRFDFAKVQVGDVILFREWHPMYDKVCHRVTYINAAGTALRTRGDNNSWPDSGWVTADEFVGIAVAVNGSAIPPKANSGWRMTNSEGQQDEVFETTKDTKSCEANAGSLITAPTEI